MLTLCCHDCDCGVGSALGLGAFEWGDRGTGVRANRDAVGCVGLQTVKNCGEGGYSALNGRGGCVGRTNCFSAVANLLHDLIFGNPLINRVDGRWTVPRD
jgi:hypothetical protein